MEDLVGQIVRLVKLPRGTVQLGSEAPIVDDAVAEPSGGNDQVQAVVKFSRVNPLIPRSWLERAVATWGVGRRLPGSCKGVEVRRGSGWGPVCCVSWCWCWGCRAYEKHTLGEGCVQGCAFCLVAV